jgi:Zn finger protein HypA/HybF involved in hydrogenase expression
MAGETGQTFICRCGKTQGWIYEGLEKKEPCPECGRHYKGIYSRKTLQIEAIEIKQESNNWFKRIFQRCGTGGQA